jgi:hypothetical protein
VQRFRCAKLIRHCGELGCKDRRGLVAEGRIGPLGVVAVGPAGHDLASIVDAKEQRLVHQLIALSTVEGFVIAVLHRLAAHDLVLLTCILSAHSRIAFEVNSVPLSVMTCSPF